MRHQLKNLSISAAILSAAILVAPLQAQPPHPKAGLAPMPLAVGQRGPGPAAAPMGPAGAARPFDVISQPGQPGQPAATGTGTQPTTSPSQRSATTTGGTGTTATNPPAGAASPARPAPPSGTIPAQPFPGTGQPAIPAQPVSPNGLNGTTTNGTPAGTDPAGTNSTGTGTDSSNQTGTNPNTTFGNTTPPAGFYTNNRSNQSQGFGVGNQQSNTNDRSLVRTPNTSSSTNGTNATNSGTNAGNTTNGSLLSTDGLLRGLSDVKLSNLSNLNGGSLVNINTAWNNVQVQALEQSLKANAGASSNAQTMTQLLQQRGLLGRNQFVVGYMGGKVYIADSGSATTTSR